MANPHGSFIWYELMSADPLASKAFYDPIMGWSIEPEPSGAADYRMISQADRNVGGVLTLTPEMTAGGARPAWVGYITVDDVDARVAAAQAAGGSVLMPAFDMPGVGRIAMIADPQGAPSYLMTPTPPPGTPDATSTCFAPGVVGHVAWNELATSDHAAALTFYATLFGWQSTEVMSMGPMGDYAFVDHDGIRIGAMMTRPDMPPSWTFYVQVPSVAVAAEAISAGGGTILHGPAEVPGGQSIVIAADPQGAVFGVVGQ